MAYDCWYDHLKCLHVEQSPLWYLPHHHTTPPPLPQPEQNLSGLPPLLPTHHQGMARVPQLQQQSLRLSINPSKQALLLCPFSAAHHPRSGTPFNSFPTANSSLATEHSSAQPNHMGNERMVLASECCSPAIHLQFALEAPLPLLLLHCKALIAPWLSGNTSGQGSS